MRIIFGIIWYQIQAVWAKIRPPRELILKIEEVKKDEHGRPDIAVVAVRDKKSNKVISRTNVILLPKEFIDEVNLVNDLNAQEKTVEIKRDDVF